MPSKSQKQHNLMVTACHSKVFAEKVGISQDVACEFVLADKKAGLWQEQDDFEQIIDYLAHASEKVRDNAVVVSSSELTHPFLLHISGEKNPTYIPRIGYRQADSEDRTMPRVTASPTLLGCIIGFSSLYDNFYQQCVATSKGVQDWKGGLYIQKIPFDYCLKPNSKLVYDQTATDEHWLIPYKKNLDKYQSYLIGKIFVDSVRLVPRGLGKDHDKEFILFVQVDEPFEFSLEKPLAKGFYRITLVYNRNTAWTSKKVVTIEEINKTEFLERKKVVAATLSANIPVSVYQQWKV